MIKQAIDADCRVQLMAFDILWYRGKSIWKRPYKERYEQLSQVVQLSAPKMGYTQPHSLVPVPNLKGRDLEEAIELVQDKHWEGLVVWRKDQSTMVHINGSPDRRNCWKIKLVKEADVVAVGYERGKGKNRNVVGKFKIAIPSSGVVFKPMGRCGTGLDDKTREEALKWKYPVVIQIEYDQKSEKGFRFPVFIRKRDDKKPSECR
jgi:ATP-dependent DNA ligase